MPHTNPTPSSPVAAAEDQQPDQLAARRAALNIISWNVLCECYFKDGKGDYGHVQDAASIEWEQRSDRLVQMMAASQADVICLQECEFSHFESCYKPKLAEHGYAGLCQAHKKRDLHPQGVATFWKEADLTLVHASHRSRTMTTSLADGQGRTVAVVNCHLEGNPRKPKDRVKQLQTTLQEVRATFEHHALVVSGDFNSGLGASAASAYLAWGHVPPSVTDWGVPISPDVAAIPRHGYTLSSAYPAHPGPTGSRFTYCGSPGHPVDGLDQVWYTHEVLTCVGTRQLHVSEETRRRMIRAGLPSPDMPSDHVPVGAAFEWAAASADVLTNLQSVVGNGAGAGAAAAGQSADEHLAIAAELLAACPFVDEHQRAEFSVVSADSPASSRKISPEEIAHRKAMRIRKEALFANADDAVKQVLAEVQRRRKLAKKAQAQQAGGTGKQRNSNVKKAAAPLPAAPAAAVRTPESRLVAAEAAQTPHADDVAAPKQQLARRAPRAATAAAHRKQRPPPSKLLMLHGWGQNSHVFRGRTKDFVKECSKVNIVPVFADGSVRLPPLPAAQPDAGDAVPVAAAAANTTGRDNARAWFVYNANNHNDFSSYLDSATLPSGSYAEWETTVEVLKTLEETSGPFDGVLGFSQGAVAAHILLATQPFAQPLKYGVLMSGFRAKMLDPRAPAIAVPTVHTSSTSGKVDTSVPPEHQAELAGCFEGPLMIEHVKGHVAALAPKPVFRAFVAAVVEVATSTANPHE